MCGTLVVRFVQIERLTHVQQSDIPKLLNASGLDSKLLYPYSIITGERLLEFAVTCFSSLESFFFDERTYAQVFSV